MVSASRSPSYGFAFPTWDKGRERGGAEDSRKKEINTCRSPFRVFYLIAENISEIYGTWNYVWIHIDVYRIGIGILAFIQFLFRDY